VNESSGYSNEKTVQHTSGEKKRSALVGT